MPTIEIRGGSVLVDEADVLLIAAHRWWVSRCTNDLFYAKAKQQDGKLIRMHRLITRAQFGQIVDHRNGDGLDNRRENLRICTHAQNSHNQTRLHRKNTTGYRGVSRCGDRFCAFICIQRRNLNLGTFFSAKDAARAYDAKARELHGEFASPNFPKEAPHS